MISGFTPTWYPQRRGVGQHVPGGYGHLVQNCKVKGFRCSRRRVSRANLFRAEGWRVPCKAFRDGSVRTRGNRIAADCCWSRVRVQICSGLKDRGCLARPSGLYPPGLAGTELQRIAVRDGCGCKSVEESLQESLQHPEGVVVIGF